MTPNNPESLEMVLGMLGAVEQGVQLMAMEAGMSPEFESMPVMYREGWLDAMKMVQDVMTASAAQIKELFG